MSLDQAPASPQPDPDEARASSGHRWLDLLAVLTLLVAAACLYAPLLKGHPPLTWDHNVHLYRAFEARQLLDQGRMLGWSDAEYAGSAPLLSYHCGGDLLAWCLGHLERQGLETIYAHTLWVALAVVVLCVWGSVRLHYGKGAAWLAGMLALIDPGELWYGGHLSFFQVGLWETSVAAALVMLGLATAVSATQQGRRGLLLATGGLLGCATLFTPLALVMLALALPVFVLALRSTPSPVEPRRLVGGLGLMLVALLAVSSYWLVPYLCENEAGKVPGLAPITARDMWEQLAHGKLLGQPGLWTGVIVCGWLSLAGRSDAFSRMLTGLLPWTLVMTAHETVNLVVQNQPTREIIAAGMLLPRLVTLLRLLGCAMAGFLLARLCEEALGPWVNKKRGTRLPWTYGFVMLALLAVIGRAGLINAPGWTPQLPQDLSLQDRSDAEQALTTAAGLDAFRQGRIALYDYGRGQRTGLLGLAALHGVKAHLLADYGASMAPNRFYSDDLTTLRRLGVTSLVGRGRLPASLQTLKPTAQHGDFVVYRLEPLPRAWTEGKGSVEVVTWNDERISLRLRDVSANSPVLLMLSHSPAWRSSRGQSLAPFPCQVRQDPPFHTFLSRFSLEELGMTVLAGQVTDIEFRYLGTASERWGRIVGLLALATCLLVLGWEHLLALGAVVPRRRLP